MEYMWRILAGAEFVLLAAGTVFLLLKRKTAVSEKKVQKLNNLLDLILRLIRSYVLIIDEKGCITMCSSSFAEGVGAESKESLQGVCLCDINSDFVRKDMVEEIEEEIKRNGELDKVYEFPGEGGKSRWIDLKVRSIIHNKALTGNMVLCTDITQEMEGKEEMLSLFRMRERILMSISHELKTPLNAIAGSADMLILSKNLGENEKTHVSNIKEAYRTLARRVDEITEYCSVKNEEIIIENREFVVQEIFDVIRNAVYIKTYEKGIGFKIEVSPDTPARLYGDAEKISSVLLQLLLFRTENTESSYVELLIYPVFREGELYLHYDIFDGGSPLSEVQMRQYLQPEDMDEINGADGGRNVMGFTVSREYVKAMGGKLQGESTYDKGNRFWFELPTRAISREKIVSIINPQDKSVVFCVGTDWKRAHAKEMMSSLGMSEYELNGNREILLSSSWSHIIIDSRLPEASEILGLELSYPCKKILVLEASTMVIDGVQKADIVLYEPFHIFMLADLLNQEENKNKRKKRQEEEELIFKTKGVKALVVDDNEVNVMVCTNILKQYGIETEEADSGVMAVQKYYANDYDFIMMDYLMPGIDGIEATKRIRNIPKKEKEPVIIALSANITRDIQSRFEEAGAQGVMTKPLELKILSKTLRKWLPREQIIESEEEKREREENLSEEVLHTVLKDMEELNIEKGLSHVLNSVESYIKVLKVCCTNVKEQISYVKAGYRIVEAVDLRINFHSLKGIFSNVGADSLAEESKKLEAAARENDREYIQKTAKEFIDRVEDFDSRLMATLTLYQDILSATTEETCEYMEREKYEELMGMAGEAVRQYDFVKITDILERLEKASHGRKRELLKQALEEIGEFHYDEVKALLEQISDTP